VVHEIRSESTITRRASWINVRALSLYASLSPYERGLVRETFRFSERQRVIGAITVALGLLATMTGIFTALLGGLSAAFSNPSLANAFADTVTFTVPLFVVLVAAAALLFVRDAALQSSERRDAALRQTLEQFEAHFAAHLTD